MKPVTLETLLADQNERIQRCNAPKGSNAILDWITDLNNDLKQSI